MPGDVKQTADISTSRLVVVLARAYRSLAEFLEGGLALQGISLRDFGILEVLLHKGPLSVAVMAPKLQVPSAAIGPAVVRLNRRGLIKRQENRNGGGGEVFELTEEGQRRISKIYGAHEKILMR